MQMVSNHWGPTWPTLHDADGVKSLGPHLTSIQQLDLSINRIGADGVKSLGTHLAHPHVHPEV